jgi:dTDP-4-dehydrorhamnose 3,5-epimerase
MPFEFTETKLVDVILVTPKVFPDSRGSFWECYKKSDFAANGIADDFVQDNHSISHKNVVRGLHFQRPPQDQAKLVRCTAGVVFDVVVDIRCGSPTFGQWEGFTLSSDNRKILYVPTGFAHGFASLADNSELSYKVSQEFHAPSEGSVAWDDSDLKIDWPVDSPMISEADQGNPLLRQLPDVFQF